MYICIYVYMYIFIYLYPLFFPKPRELLSGFGEAMAMSISTGASAPSLAEPVPNVPPGLPPLSAQATAMAVGCTHGSSGHNVWGLRSYSGDNGQQKTCSKPANMSCKVVY